MMLTKFPAYRKLQKHTPEVIEYHKQLAYKNNNGIKQLF